jgi:Tfp pilus assembly PilM family ATPase
MNWNSLKKFIRAVDQRLDDYLRRLDEGDVEEGGTGGGARTKNLAETIARLTNEGVKVAEPISLMPGSKLKHAFIQGPDYIRIELVEGLARKP